MNFEPSGITISDNQVLVKSTEITEIRVWAKSLTGSLLRSLSVQPLPLATRTEFNVNLVKRGSLQNKPAEVPKEQKKGLKMASKFDKKKIEKPKNYQVGL